MEPTANNQDIAPDPFASEQLALNRMISELRPLTPDGRQRLIDLVCTFFGLNNRQPEPVSPPRERQRTVDFKFSDTETPTAKRFLQDKAPGTDVERVACLGYYLTHFRNTPHFKTKDITDLNTEAAQRRFSNTADSVDNATRAGYLVPSIKGCKQLSAHGEEFVDRLPDRDAAREAMSRVRPSRSVRTGKRSKPSEQE